jgi:ribosomal protein L40E
MSQSEKALQAFIRENEEAAKRILGSEAQRIKTPAERRLDEERKLRGPRPRVLHFIWKGSQRLTLALGGKVIAAWPQSDKGMIDALLDTKMIKRPVTNINLSWNQAHVRSMALRLRAVLLKAEDGPRHKSAQRQRMRIDRLFRLGAYRPITNRAMSIWTCRECGAKSPADTSLCVHCHADKPR